MKTFFKLVLLVWLPAFIALLLARLLAEKPTYLSGVAAESAGGAFFVLIVAIAWNTISVKLGARKPDAKESAGIRTGALIAAWVVTGFAVYGQFVTERRADSTPSEAMAQEYRGNGCELSVTFPKEPKITAVTLQPGAGVRDAERAEVETADSYLRVECFRQPGVGAITPEEARELVAALAAEEGLTDVQVVPQDQSHGVVAGVRGNKLIDGISATYETTMFFWPDSFMGVITATKAENYPTQAILQFRKSLKAADRDRSHQNETHVPE